MKKTTFLMLLLILINCSFGQTKSDKFSFTWFKEGPRSNDKSFLTSFYLQDDKNVVLTRTVLNSFSTEYSYEFLNSNFEKDFSKNTIENYNKEKIIYMFSLQTSKHVYLCYLNGIMNSDKVELLVQDISQKPQQNGEPKLIKVVEKKNEGKFVEMGFTESVSNDKSKVLLFFNDKSQAKDNSAVFVNVLNEELNILWKKSLKFPNNKNIEVVDYKVDNLGNVSFLCKVDNETKENKNKELNYCYKLFCYTNSGADFNEFKVKLDGKVLLKPKIEINLSNEVVCTGLYSNIGNESSCGIFYTKVNPKVSGLPKISTKDFDSDFIFQSMSDKDVSKTNKLISKGEKVECPAFIIQHILFTTKGEVYILGENYFKYQADNSSGRYSKANNDIIVACVMADGNIGWVKRISKNQIEGTGVSTVMSYAPLLVSDKLYLLFNDDYLNENFNGKGKPADFKADDNKGITVIININSNGDIDRNVVLNNVESNMTIHPNKNIRISDNEFLFYSSNGKKEKYVRLTIEK